MCFFFSIEQIMLKMNENEKKNEVCLLLPS
jgi:hypothetical protein